MDEALKEKIDDWVADLQAQLVEDIVCAIDHSPEQIPTWTVLEGVYGVISFTCKVKFSRESIGEKT